jgi:hypothetical protein
MNNRIQFVIHTLKKIEDAVCAEPDWDSAPEGRVRAVVDLYIAHCHTEGN